MSLRKRIERSLIIAFVVRVLTHLMFFMFGGVDNRPNINRIRSITSQLLSYLKQEPNAPLHNIPMFQAKGGINSVAVYLPQTSGFPVSVFFDWYDWRRAQQIYVKICYVPNVVENIKMRQAGLWKADRSGMEYGTVGWEGALARFETHPCRLLTDLLQDPKILAVWLLLVDGADVSPSLLHQMGMDEAGRPLPEVSD